MAPARGSGPQVLPEGGFPGENRARTGLPARVPGPSPCQVPRPSRPASPSMAPVPEGASMNALPRVLLAACLALVAGTALAVPETTPALCSNGVDDDTPPNGLADCDDPTC